MLSPFELVLYAAIASFCMGVAFKSLWDANNARHREQMALIEELSGQEPVDGV